MALSKQPDSGNSSEPNDNLEEPLNRHSLTILSLVNFLTEHPDEKFYVADLRLKTSPAPGDGLLLIGPGKTLQAKFGQNRFAVISNSGRFQLTPESAARFREMKKQDALTMAAARPAVNDYRELFASFIRPAATKTHQTETVKESALGAFEDKLKELLMKPSHITANTIGFSIICDSSRVVHDCLHMAERAGFRIVNLINYGLTTVYQAIIGREIGALLRKALIDSDHRHIADALLQTDDKGFGPYALVFHPACGELIILNKYEATRQYQLVKYK